VSHPVAEVSPWQAALGDRFADLHPRLGKYFGRIPEGSVGEGSGVFEVVGTPRRWLWPVLAILGRAGILFPAWERDVPFTVANRSRRGGVDAERTFFFATGARVMVDAIAMTPRGLVDRLGRRGWLQAGLVASVENTALVLRSDRIRVLGMRVPGLLAPRLVLTERFDDPSGSQRVSLVLEAPVIGRVYEYAGSFDYRITEDA
jgi:hypothetical protein